MSKNHKALQDINVYRQIFYLWMFISQEGLWDDAKDFLKENMDNPTPFESEMHKYN